MANTNTDLTEEDAADLQFPKDKQSVTTLPYFSNIDLVECESMNDVCVNCDNDLGARFILCVPCKVKLCCVCFSNGVEFLAHRNDHDYQIFHMNFNLFDNTDWTAEEELKLLDSLNSFGNWNLVAKEFPNRTLDEVVQHYEYFYLDGHSCKDMPRFRESEAAVFPQIIVPYKYKLHDCDDPPRYACNSLYYQNLAGYNAARSEFENEYDANAEDLLANLELLDESDPFYDLSNTLQIMLIERYNRRLKERQRWKKVIRDHGLISLRKTLSWLRRYDLTITKPVYEKMMRFMQLCDPMSFDALMESLHRAGELKIQISRLISLRRQGITTLAEGKLYLRLYKIHEDNKKSLKAFRSNSQFNWRTIKNNFLPVFPKFPKRRQGFSPLDVAGLPGYEKLTDKERDLCSNVRLIPETYLDLKKLLIMENNKMGHVKLQTARKLLKIDVNKTRRLYDFLVEEGFIAKSNS